MGKTLSGRLSCLWTDLAVLGSQKKKTVQRVCHKYVYFKIFYLQEPQ